MEQEKQPAGKNRQKKAKTSIRTKAVTGKDEKVG
jgi:hypothetical protein